MVHGGYSDFKTFETQNRYKYISKVSVNVMDYVYHTCVNNHDKFAYIMIYMDDADNGGLQFDLCVTCANEFLRKFCDAHKGERCYRRIKIDFSADALLFLIQHGFGDVIKSIDPIIINPKREFMCPVCKVGHMWESNPDKQDGKWYCASVCPNRMILTKDEENKYLNEYWNTLKDRM